MTDPSRRIPAPSDRRGDPRFATLLLDSYRRLVGVHLCPPVWASDAEAAQWLYEEAPFGLLAHDGSDDPLGVLAIAALVALVASLRGELRAAPRLGWLLLASLGTLAATALHGVLPPLLSGLVAVLAWACGLLAFLPRRVAALPVAGLAVLALPLLSSLQF